MSDSDARRPSTGKEWPLPAFAARESFLGTSNYASDAAIAVAGVPLDIATTNRAGARDGPAAIRRASRMVGGTYPDLWPNTYDLDFADVGNFGLLMGNLNESLAMIQEQATEHDHLIAMGGDHLVSLPLLRAAARKHGPLGMVHFDAHVDTWAENYGAPVTHGTNFRIAIDEGLVDPERMIQIGIRGIITRLQAVDVVGMDLVEVAPAYDVGEITALAGASMICFYMGLLAGRQDSGRA